ncbi:MAG TPA: hypothetical protein VD883_02375 [Candidatus Omnitrophota bacterium]|nr:hypothetical protein [Candidatus Omnitrophota bacterium]
MADEPLDDLGGRTPLEVAKKPHMDALAKKGRVGRALFTPHTLAAASDVACLSILGFNPEESYTGIAPLEAVTMGLSQKDQDVAFRCDLVTVMDDVLFDTSASRITPAESKLLVAELNKKLGDKRVQFYPGDGYKNILMISDPELAESLDELECTSPRRIIGQKFVKSLPKGRAANVLTELMDKSKEVLENHEINRVRIDLNENPANMIWPWGQGRRPKLGSFIERYKIQPAYISKAEYVRGLAKLLGIPASESVEKAAAEADAIFVYEEGRDGHRPDELKAKIKRIEDFDSQVVGPVVKLLDRFSDARILVTTDCASSITKQMPFHGYVPFLVCGTGIVADEAQAFNEKQTAQSQWLLDAGYQLMESLLKK